MNTQPSKDKFLAAWAELWPGFIDAMSFKNLFSAKIKPTRREDRKPFLAFCGIVTILFVYGCFISNVRLMVRGFTISIVVAIILILACWCFVTLLMFLLFLWLLIRATFRNSGQDPTPDR